MIKPFSLYFSTLTCLGLLADMGDVFATESTAEGLTFFEKKIRPVLVENCYKCHSANSEKVKGELLLDTREGIRKGGESGHAVVPKNLDESLLIAAIRYGDEDLEMPPKEKLPASVIADFEKWIMMGAPDPRDGKATSFFKPNWEKSKNHWAFKVPKQPVIPKVKDGDWARTDVDRFVLAELEEKSMKPVGDVDRRTLIRRLFFDLNGVPPQPKEVEAFINDKDPKAYEKLIDRLLGSESFGERWGRHWLDVARYAESSGKESNITYPHAWRYRDYVIDSFNADKPYNQFVREQVAGDMLRARDDKHRAELMTATGFLAIGPKSHNEGSRSQFAADLADEQIETMSRSMLGLTIACARCHDHKFDPIPQREYYAMAGIFQSTATYYGTVQTQGNRRNSRLMTLPTETAAIKGRPLTAESRARLDKILADSRKQREEMTAKAAEDRKNGTGDSFVNFIRLRSVRDRMNTVTAQLNNYDVNGTAKPQTMGVRERGYGRDTRLLERGEVRRPRQVVPRGFVKIVNPDYRAYFSRRASGRLQLAEWLVTPGNPLTSRVMINRIWHHLFGQGLVRSMDNFGSTGEAPSHPELLDHLALRFTKNSWSIKGMVREIVLSRTYQLASDYDSANFNTDPDNRYLWRMSKRRLDAESIRDSMLSVSSLLNWDRPRGSAVANAGDGRVGRGRTQSRTLMASTDHRSVFLPIVRDLVPESLNLFDYAEPSMVTGKRDVTTVPSQALYLMNSPFVVRAADAMARRLIAEQASPDERIKLAYQLVYSRPPTATELERTQQFFNRYLAGTDGNARSSQYYRGNAMSAFCQALLCSAEFRYLN